MNSYTYDGEGMLTAAGSAQYTYDALQQRVEKTGGSNPDEIIYFNDKPMALLNATSGAWTDLIWAGNNIIAEVPGSQTATPVYRLLDHEGSLVATTDNSGNINSSNLLAPYGQLMASNTSDPYLYAGLYQDTEYGGHAAWYRNYSAEQARWLRPDPYNGSYDLMNPQSFNRYMYVNGNPLTYVDPSGLSGGWATGWGGACHFSGAIIGQDSNFPFNPCSPVSSGISIGVYAAIHGLWGSVTVKQIVPVVGAALTIACSIDDFNKSACGPSGWTSAFIGGDAGKVVGDSIAAIGAILCATDPGGPACTGYIIYTIANDLFSVFWDLFGPPHFTGSLLPRPSDLGGLGTSPIGIPNNNATLKELIGSASHVTIPSPQPNLP